MSAWIQTRRVRTSPIGLDIGHMAVRAAQLRCVADRYELLHAARLDLPRGEAGEIDIVASAPRIRRTLRAQGFTGRAAIVGVAPPDAELHVLDLPEQAASGLPAQVAQAARLELERLMSYPPGTVETAHWWLPARRGGKPGAIGVAVPRDRVSGLWEFCRGVGLECRRVDAQACAWARIGSAIRQAAPDSRQTPGSPEVWGVLDIGQRSARLILCIADVPVLTRSLDAGGDRWTDLIADGLGISQGSAEVHKRDHGVPADREPRPEHNVSTSGDIAEMILNILHPALEAMASQVERSYAYVLQCHPQTSAGGLILAGGGAALKNLDAHLAVMLGIDVRRADDIATAQGSGLVDVRPALTQRTPLAELACAIGLAMEPSARPKLSTLPSAAAAPRVKEPAEVANG